MERELNSGETERQREREIASSISTKVRGVDINRKSGNIQET
jgi:hypothetical protein